MHLFDMNSKNQGIVHVIGPELGITQPGQTIVCGDSHTSTHGAFGALAFGIGTSEVEHVLATQCLSQFKSKTMKMEVQGKRPKGVTAKDIILAIIGKIGIAGGTGHVVEYTGEAIRGLSMEGRMTMCNMSIEGGARAGMVAPDETTFAYMEGRPFVPRGKEFQDAVEHWKTLASDPGAKFDATVKLHARRSGADGYLGNESGHGDAGDRNACRTRFVPAIRSIARRRTRALDYMGLKPGTPMEDIPLDRVFIGSCTNSRLEDLRAAAKVVAGRARVEIAEAGAGGARFARGEGRGGSRRAGQNFSATRDLNGATRDAACASRMNETCCRAASARRARRTGILKGGRARTAGRTW